MTSIRKRLQKEKIDLQKELMSYDKDFIDKEIEAQEEYELLYGWEDYEWDDDYDDWDDDWDDVDDINNHKYEDDFWWWYEDYDIESAYKPGNHIEDKKTGDIYIVVEDYRLVNILTGVYKEFIQDYKVVL